MTPKSTCSCAANSACLTAQRVPVKAVGCFKLMPGRALTLTFKAPALLTIGHGSAWITFANAACDVSARAGDHFLSEGQSLQMRAGQAVVLEAFCPELYFDFTFDAQRLVVFQGSKPATTATPARDFLHAAIMVWTGLRFRLANHWQSAHSYGQTHPHPFAAATRECQS